MPDSTKQAHDLLVKGGLKSDFATTVVSKSGYRPEEIIKHPAKVVEDYWYKHINVDFLKDAVALNAKEFKEGLKALELQTAVVDKASATPPRSELLGHRDIFGWGIVVFQGRL